MGDEVTIAGHRGYVKNVNIMSTELKQIDNPRVIIPNSKVWNNPIINGTRMPTRMIALEYSVSYTTVISDAVSVKTHEQERGWLHRMIRDNE
ncbi:mechanosensitive ion channel domain-containing protein [Methanoculleus frigidifontis]|uniref:mechanosensitive ion channel domain-containing protein n=1 Tax=Methanoculleus frigidifontis TaxID=2584085 RepID=UPI00265A413A|nr:mechanosensitive ion channel domain-containing protein [Methanoculleus sp. FWC-SCC1]